MRFVLHRKGWLLSIAVLALLLVGVLWWRAAEARSWHHIGSINPLWAETPLAAEVDGKPVFLTLVDGKVTAFNRQIPHPRGCNVEWHAREHRFIEGCLGTTFEQDGTYVRGPSWRHLDRFAVRVAAGEVAINPSVSIYGASLEPPRWWQQIKQWFVDLW